MKRNAWHFIKSFSLLLFIFLINNHSFSQTPQDYFNTGTTQFFKGQYSLAYNSFLSSMSSSHSGDIVFEQANYYLINCCLKQKDESQALNEISLLKERNPSSPIWDDIDFLFGSYYYYKYEFSQSAEWFDDLVNNHPDSMYHPQALLYQMWLGFWDNDDNAIDQAYSTLISRYSDKPEISTALCEKGQFALRKEDYSHAESYFNEVLSNYTQYRWAVADARSGLGNILLHQHKYGEAIVHFRVIKAMNLADKWNAIADDLIGYSYNLQGNYSAAREQYQSIIDSYQNLQDFQSSAQYEIGECYYREGLWSNALDSFEKLVSQYPNSSQVNMAKEKILQLNEIIGPKP